MGKTLTASMTPHKVAGPLCGGAGACLGLSQAGARLPASGETVGREGRLRRLASASFCWGRPPLLLRPPTSVCPPWPPRSFCHAWRGGRWRGDASLPAARLI